MVPTPSWYYVISGFAMPNTVPGTDKFGVHMKLTHYSRMET